MNKNEILSLGVKEENYRAFQEMYIRDVNKAAKQEAEKLVEELREGQSVNNTDGQQEQTNGGYYKQEAEKAREAIRAVLPLIKDLHRLLFLVEEVNRQFSFDKMERRLRNRKEAAQGVREDQNKL
ncbi:MAG: hypothetical protein ACI4MK_12575 [Aristaeellaceae bacterium]